jgi:3-oxoacyl-[acyl-carrier protein] reductase
VDLGITGKTALITASSRGLGFASALALAHEGVNVTICARGKRTCVKAEKRLRQSGAAVLAVPIDLTLPYAPTRLVETAVEFHGSPRYRP